MARAPIDIFAGLEDLSRAGKSGDKFGIAIRGSRGGRPALLFNPDEKPITMRVAGAMAKVISDNLLEGKAPDGRSLGGIDPDTEENRRNLEAQAARGGAPAHLKNPTLVGRAQRNFHREYHAPRLGTFSPRAGGPRGVVSGMTARSPAVRPAKDGTGFNVYFASKRGRVQPGDDEAPIQRILRGVPLWSKEGMAQPPVREAMKLAARSLIGKSTIDFLRAGADLAASLGTLLSTVEESGDD